MQWVATVIVFAALLADAVWGKKALFNKKQPAKDVENPTADAKANGVK